MDFLNQHKLWIGGAAATILLFSCACCGCGGIFVGLPALRERAKPKVAATFDAEDFMEKTKDNTAVMADHNGRTIEIVGAFGRLSSTIRNENFLSFKETGQRHHSPRCFIKNLGQAKDLKAGDEIVVQGELRISGGLIDLANCTVRFK